MSKHFELLVGSDFGAPLTAGAQSKKIIVIEASRTGHRHYEIATTGRNEKLIREFSGNTWGENRRGWNIPDLAKSISEDPTVTLAAFDFPFSIPVSLLESSAFAGTAGADAFHTRMNWVRFVGQHIQLAFSSNNAGAKLHFSPVLHGWKNKEFWVRRATDVVTYAQPPLKHLFQNVFNMTLVGSKFLDILHDGGMQILLRPVSSQNCLGRTVIETYPAAVAARVGFDDSYKRYPHRCLEAAERYLREQGITLDFHAAIRKFCVEYRTSKDDPDAADAFLCLVSAICFREGLAEWRSGAGTTETQDEEGCIVTPAKIQPDLNS